MSTSGKIALGVGIASSALLAAWLLTGSRKERTKKFVAKQASNLRTRTTAAKTVEEEQPEEEVEAFYI